MASHLLVIRCDFLHIRTRKETVLTMEQVALITKDTLPLPILGPETDQKTRDEIMNRINVILNNDKKVTINDNFPYQLKEKIGDMIKSGYCVGN